ncbi:MAG: hypothetical protein KKF77_04655 [Proteobacteria bacterium]|nr:hypothetical protein [Pseudomonadota bacterium]
MAKVIRINAQPHVTGGRFCRAGRCFGTVPTELAEGDLTPEQLAALQAEPMLVVEIAEVLKPTEPQAKAEAQTKADKKPEAAKPTQSEQDESRPGEGAPGNPAPTKATEPGAAKDGKPEATKPADKAKADADAKAGAKPAAKPDNKEGGK